jgi:hypothetical protein
MFEINERRTSELTRRRESKHPSPHQASCERRSRRSRPTICWVGFELDHATWFVCLAPEATQAQPEAARTNCSNWAFAAATFSKQHSSELTRSRIGNKQPPSVTDW